PPPRRPSLPHFPPPPAPPGRRPPPTPHPSPGGGGGGGPPPPSGETGRLYALERCDAISCDAAASSRGRVRP
ncbi:hypothetical protein K6X08_38705, partial [Burkholderia contaminans]|uniref:hypothetical protein n=1 Tax=Burkholderia contaminans TaxID=488447 RepID=UPI001C967A36